MKHILFIQPSLDAVGGIEKVVPTLARELSSANYIVSTYIFYGNIPSDQDFWRTTGSEQEVATTGYIDKIKKIIRRLQSLCVFVRQTKPDYLVVSAQGAIILTILLRCLGLIKVPVIAYVHEARGDGGTFYRVLTALFYPLADRLITVSKGIQKEIQSLWLMNSSKVYLVYNSLPNVTFGVEIENAIKDEVMQYEAPLYCTAGRLELTKGSDILIRSFIEFAKTNVGTLLVLGTGSLQESLKAEVLRAGMGARIVFRGKVDTVPLYIKHCHAYVSMARSEPFGLALIESLSVGTPVIATDVPSGPREILSPDMEITTYPYRGRYGVMLAHPSVLDVTTVFEQGVAVLAKSPYDKKGLQERANDFSPASQRDAFIEVLKK